MSSPQSFAHYTVVEKIGAGGMGEVFRATDSRLNRDVALKMLPDTLIDNAERLARFQREAQVLAALNHHGIAAIYGLESEGSRHALAMELVEGPDLSDRLISGTLPVAEALDVALQLAEAVEAAHEKGIVHRDLKPANIKINTEGRVKVLDFGLAKALSDDPATSGIDPAMSPTLTANMTMGNVILGTAAYMSPEQARGTEVDKRADIWAYGVVLVEMLGGRRLFAGETVSDTLASVLQAAIDLDDLPSDLPPSVKRLIRRCLQRDPRQRLRDIGDARLVLQDAINGPEEEVEEASRTKNNPWIQWAAVGVAVVAVAAAMLGYLSPGEKTVLPLRKSTIEMDSKDHSSNVGFFPALSPDGRSLVYVSQGQLWMRDLASMDSRLMPGTEGAASPFWSPDSEWIGYATGSEIRKIDRSGGQSMTLASVTGSTATGGAGSAVWNLDGSIFYTTGNTGILQTSSHAGEVSSYHLPGEGEVDFHGMCALPDGKGWVFVVHTTVDYGSLDVLSPSGERRNVIDFDGDSISKPVWSPTGHILFEREEVAAGIWAVPFDPDKLEVTGSPFLVAAGSRAPTVSEDGTLVYASGVSLGMVQVAWFDRQGKFLSKIAEVSTARPFPNLSPDETQVLLTANTDSGREIWVFDTTNGNERRLTFDGKRWGAAIWHPDGKHIVSYTEPDYYSYLFTLDGSEPPRALGPGILNNLSKDGETFFYSKPQLEAGFNFDIHARPLDAPIEEGRALVASPAVEWQPVPSPNGKYLIYVSDESGVQEIYATTYPGLTGRWQVSRGGAGWAMWSEDGKQIYYTNHREIFSVPVDETGGFTLGRPVKLMDRPTTDWSPSWPDGFDITADGQRWVMLASLIDENEEQPRLIVVQNWFAEFSE